MTNNFTTSHPILKKAQQPSDNTAREIHTCTNPGNCTQHGRGKQEENISTQTEAGNCTHGRRHTTRNKYQCTTTLKHACMSTPVQVQNTQKRTLLFYTCAHIPTQEKRGPSLVEKKGKENVLRFSHKAKNQEQAQYSETGACTDICWQTQGYTVVNMSWHTQMQTLLLIGIVDLPPSR